MTVIPGGVLAVTGLGVVQVCLTPLIAGQTKLLGFFLGKKILEKYGK